MADKLYRGSTPVSGGMTINNGEYLTIDGAMSDTSENAVQNKVVKAYIDAQTTDVSAETDNAIETKADGIYVKTVDLSDYAKTSDVEDAISAVHEHTNKDLLDKLGEDDEGNLTLDGVKVDNDTLIAISTNTGNAIQNLEDGLFVSTSGVEISSEAGNAITSKDDGLYVSATGVEVSAVAGNTITTKSDGLYAQESISTNTGNALERKADGLFVSSSGVEISSEEGNAITSKSDGLYVSSTGVQVSALADNVLETKDDGLYVAKVEIDTEDAISAKDGNIITRESDGLYATATTSIDISEKDGNIIVAEADGLYAKADEITEITISEDDGNSLVLKDDGLYVPSVAETHVSEEDGNAIVKKDDGIYVAVVDPEDAISAESGNALTRKDDGLYVAAGAVVVSEEADNTVEVKADGLYVAPTDLSAYAKTTEVEEALEAVHSHENKALLDSIEADNVHKHENKALLDSIEADNVHKHENKELLDKLSANAVGALVFDGVEVATSNVSVSSTEGNIATIDDTGLFVPETDLSAYVKSDDLTTTLGDYATTSSVTNSLTNYTTTTAMNTKFDSYYTKSLSDGRYVPKSGYLNNNGAILGGKIAANTLSHFKLTDIGTMTHDELEVLLNNHLSNSIIHNIASLNQITIQTTSWNEGTYDGFIVNNDSNLSLSYTDETDEDAGEVTRVYTTQTASFISRVYDVGSPIAFNSVNWFGSYHPYLAEVNIFERHGESADIDDGTWTEWNNITVDKSMFGITTQFFQIKVEAKTADRYRDIVLKYIQVYYGESSDSEVQNAKISDYRDKTYNSMKERFEEIEAEVGDNYYTNTEIDTMLSDYYKKTEIDTTLEDYYTKTEIDELLTPMTDEEVDAIIEEIFA